MKVYVALPEGIRAVLFDDATWRRLEGLAQVEVLAEGASSLPADLCATCDVLVTGWGTPRLERIDGDRLRLIVHTAGSWREALGEEVLASTVDIAQAGSDLMARAVAEFALTLELALLRELHTYDRGLQTTRDWARSRAPEYGTGIHSLRHGIVGLSRVGIWHARMLRGLGCEDLVAFDPYCPDERAAQLGVRLVSLDEVMASPVVALHAPVTPETRGMVGAAQLARIPDGGVLLNTARAAIVDMEALERELVSGRLRAGLDVFAQEPLSPQSALFGLPNVILTPHVAGATTGARLEQGAAAVEEIGRFAAGEPLRTLIVKETAGQLS